MAAQSTGGSPSASPRLMISHFLNLPAGPSFGKRKSATGVARPLIGVAR